MLNLSLAYYNCLSNWYCPVPSYSSMANNMCLYFQCNSLTYVCQREMPVYQGQNNLNKQLSLYAWLPLVSFDLCVYQTHTHTKPQFLIRGRKLQLSQLSKGRAAKLVYHSTEKSQTTYMPGKLDTTSLLCFPAGGLIKEKFKYLSPAGLDPKSAWFDFVSSLGASYHASLFHFCLFPYSDFPL